MEALFINWLDVNCLRISRGSKNQFELKVKRRRKQQSPGFRRGFVVLNLVPVGGLEPPLPKETDFEFLLSNCNYLHLRGFLWMSRERLNLGSEYVQV